MCIGKGTNPIGSYVAMTRVEKREDMLIYRPFERELFTRGARKGPELLLKQLRGEYIDWKAIEDEYMPRKRCVGCNFVQYKEQFQPQQWSKKDKRSICKTCVEVKVREGTPFQCTNCCLFLVKEAFSRTQQHANSINTRVCNDCVERRVCCDCGVAQTEDKFSPGEWKHGRWNSCARGKCRQCQLKFQCDKVCSECNDRLPRRQFSQTQWDKADAGRKCTPCIKRKEAEITLKREKKCSKCEYSYTRGSYSTEKMWNTKDEERKCTKCIGRKRGFWPCIGCPCTKPVEEFSKWWRPRAHKKNDGTARCNACMEEFEHQEDRLRKKSVAKVMQQPEKNRLVK